VLLEACEELHEAGQGPATQVVRGALLICGVVVTT
jgi:hypothetical protein